MELTRRQRLENPILLTRYSVKAIAREMLITRMCKLHRRRGAQYNIGLGFYEGLRFHLDSEGDRVWGSDFHAATSPCLKVL